jgi:hypothetical protein
VTNRGKPNREILTGPPGAGVVGIADTDAQVG